MLFRSYLVLPGPAAVGVQGLVLEVVQLAVREPEGRPQWFAMLRRHPLTSPCLREDPCW